MMTATDYILKEIESLVRKFSAIRVRYEYNRMAEVHFIEITPSHVYRSDDGYIDWENETIGEFIKLFPTQNICFISDDSLDGIRNAEYATEGIAFAPLSTTDSRTAVTPEMITIDCVRILDSGNSVTLPGRNKEDLFFNYTVQPESGYQLAA